MPQKSFVTENLGSVLVVKRKGAKNIRLSINADGLVRVSLPPFVPYSVGLSFANKREAWLLKHLDRRSVRAPGNGSRIGKSHRLILKNTVSGAAPTSKIKDNEITVSVPANTSEASVKAAITKACEKALKLEAQALLPIRLETLAKTHNYDYSSVKIRKLKSRWGSCSDKQVITLSIFLIQLPWHLIDYVLLHELNHTRHMHHQKAFWDQLSQELPGARSLRKEIKSYSPTILPG
jgi:predicted metal-dependent hydrolase